jgi:hypothetical protein
VEVQGKSAGRYTRIQSSGEKVEACIAMGRVAAQKQVWQPIQ